MLKQWFLGEDPASAPAASDELVQLVAGSLPGVHPTTASIVGAIAGLCAAVAHADRVYTSDEEAVVRRALSRITVLEPGTVDAVAALLTEHGAEISAASVQTYTRVLSARTSAEARVEVLDLLMELAGADDVLDAAESNMLRRIAAGLDIEDREYLATLSRHRERLSAGLVS